MIGVQPAELGKISQSLAKPLKKISTTAPLQWLAKNYQRDPIKFVGYTSLATVVLKDFIGGIFYVTQSLHNEKIPEEKRSFVAALDFTNSILMITTQIAAFLTVQKDKCIDFFFDHTIGKYFNRANRRGYKEIMRNKLPELERDQFTKAFKDARKAARDGFKVFLPLIAATIFAKRVVVPFLSTPAASWAKEKIFKDTTSLKKEEAENKPNSNTISNVNSDIMNYASMPDIYKKHFK